MTGRYEEPETVRDSSPSVPASSASRHDFAAASPASSAKPGSQDKPASDKTAAQGASPAASAVAGQSAQDSSDHGQAAAAQYVDPQTHPGQQNYPAQAGEHPIPSYVDPDQQFSGPQAVHPAGSFTPYGGDHAHPYLGAQFAQQPEGNHGVTGPAPLAFPGPQAAAPWYSDPTVSGQQNPPGPPYAAGTQPGVYQSGQPQPGQYQPGPYQADPYQPGPYQTAGGQPGEHAGQYISGQLFPMAGQPIPGAQQPPQQQPPQQGPAQQGPVEHEQGQHPFSAQSQVPASAAGGDQPFGQDLSSTQLLRQSKRAPQSGWRRAVYKATGRAINFGESTADLRRRELIARINQPLHGCYKIAMLSLKGGVGKTTTTATLGSTFASLRGDRVIAVDANPDRGTLSQKIPLETTATVRHLLRDALHIRKYSDVRAYTSQGPSRLEILASEQDPAVSEAFSEDDYRRSVMLLEHFYNVVLTDCGTGLMHSAMKGVLDVADSLVIVSSSSIDGARSASATLDWLDAHGYGDLVGRSVAVINSVRPGSGKVDVNKLSAHFNSRCRAVSRIPFDPHLEEGAEVELDQLAQPTRLALLELAAIVADDFPQTFGRQRQ